MCVWCRGFEVAVEGCRALAAVRVRTALAFAAGWVILPLGTTVLHFLVEGPHHVVQRHRVDTQLRGESHVSPDVAACRFRKGKPRACRAGGPGGASRKRIGIHCSDAKSFIKRNHYSE